MSLKHVTTLTVLFANVAQRLAMYVCVCVCVCVCVSAYCNHFQADGTALYSVTATVCS